MNLDLVLFTLLGKDITLGTLLGLIVMSIILFIGYRFLKNRYLRALFEKHDVNTEWRKRINLSVGILIATLFAIFFVSLLDLDVDLFLSDSMSIPVSTILQVLLVLELAQILNWIINKSIVKKQQGHGDPDTREALIQEGTRKRQSISKTIQYALYTVALMYIVKVFNLDVQLFSFDLGGQSENPFVLTVNKIFYGFLVFFVARIIAWFATQIVLLRYYLSKDFELGTRYAINQLLTYTIYVITILVILTGWGININLILGGIAALLVGIGLGLQDTFNDFTSGIVLLFERNIEVGDVVEIGDEPGIVKKIGLRASKIETRDNIVVLVPNSKLVHNPIVNWSHMDEKARFHVEVGVAYGSDTQLVKRLLLQAADENPYVLKYPQPKIMFNEFGNSSLDFKLFFWSRNYIILEFVKSDLRFEIDKLFRENGVTIPFPQRDVHFYNSDKKDTQ